ncbi:MAG TPA: hypothetical protein PLS50_06810 [Candidatus Dojkabacteria bacterium]|nr:hypothetical protein [Candidatus Dojkabacteria bacterium]
MNTKQRQKSLQAVAGFLPSFKTFLRSRIHIFFFQMLPEEFLVDGHHRSCACKSHPLAELPSNSAPWQEISNLLSKPSVDIEAG